jgi:hypothetical protein
LVALGVSDNHPVKQVSRPILVERCGDYRLKWKIANSQANGYRDSGSQISPVFFPLGFHFGEQFFTGLLPVDFRASIGSGVNRESFDTRFSGTTRNTIPL